MARRTVQQHEEMVYQFAVLAFLLFAVRDAFTGSIRYLFTVLHVDFLWFIPDLMAFAALVYFAVDQVQRRQNLLGTLLVAMFLFSTVVGGIFMKGSASMDLGLSAAAEVSATSSERQPRLETRSRIINPNATERPRSATQS